MEVDVARPRRIAVAGHGIDELGIRHGELSLHPLEGAGLEHVRDVIECLKGILDGKDLTINTPRIRLGLGLLLDEAGTVVGVETYNVLLKIEAKGIVPEELGEKDGDGWVKATR